MRNAYLTFSQYCAIPLIFKVDDCAPWKIGAQRRLSSSAFVVPLLISQNSGILANKTRSNRARENNVLVSLESGNDWTFNSLVADNESEQWMYQRLKNRNLKFKYTSLNSDKNRRISIIYISPLACILENVFKSSSETRDTDIKKLSSSLVYPMTSRNHVTFVSGSFLRLMGRNNGIFRFLSYVFILAMISALNIL